MTEKTPFEDFIDSNEYPISYVRFTAPDDSVDGQKKRKKQFTYFISGYAARLIRSILDKSGFSEIENIEEALLIVGSALKEEQENELKFFQRTNHYTQTFSLGSKEGYHFLMKHLAGKIGELPSCYPESYHLPNELSELTENFKSSDFWIRKPAGGARGQGIEVITNEEIPKVLPGRKIIVQKYIKDPLLINGLKFDLRFYVAVTSLDPLKVYLFDNGLVRLATQPYKDNIDNIGELTAHLTNFSINRDKANFVVTNDIEKDGTGNKWSHRPFWPYLEQNFGFNVDEIKKKIEDAFVQVIIAAHRNFKEQPNHRCAFELFGFDVMLDENQNIYILEVNVTPALGTSSELDRFIKMPLVKDIFNIALIPKTDSMAALQKVEMLMNNYHPNQEGENDSNNDMSDEQKQKLRDVIVVCEYELSKMREGGFHCIWPTGERWDQMNELLETKTENDEMLARWVKMNEEEQKAFLEERFAELKNFVSPE